MVKISRLESFGIQPASAAVLQHAEHNRLESEEFFEKAATALGALEGIVREDVVNNLNEYYGRWHPSGFMVYPLGTHPELGGLRLHVWPEGFRQRELKGLGKLDDQEICDGDIHNHSWHIASRVLGGEYSDTMYDVRNTEVDPGSLSDEEVAAAGLWHVFQVKYRTTARPEGLHPTGRYVSADIISNRQVDAGETHIIEAGPFHAPTIPEHRLGATLVFNSFRVIPEGPDILVAGSSMPIIGNRVDVSAEEAVEVRSQLK